jgi:glycosyltransferase involved in cell wall biosynthesis
VATLRHHKRPDILVRIASSLPDVKFVVCGGATNYQTPDGYGKDVVEALTHLPNVDYRGRVSPQEAMDVIAGAALLLCTSDEEGFPNTFIQAWSSGTPVVSLKIDPDNIIKNEGLGMVSGTVDTAVADVKALLAATNRREEIALRARKYINEKHNEAAVIDIFSKALLNGPIGSQKAHLKGHV